MQSIYAIGNYILSLNLNAFYPKYYRKVNAKLFCDICVKFAHGRADS